MIEKIAESNPKFEWVDLVNPSEEELDQLAEKYALHKMAVRDCLFPHHLPKYEKFTNTIFIIVRSYDNASSEKATSVRELTRKVAIFITDKTIITIHRTKFAFVETAKEHFYKKMELNSEQCSLSTVLNEVLHLSIKGYEFPLEECQKKLEEFESTIFNLNASLRAKETYSLVRKVSVIKRMLTLFLNVIQKIEDQPIKDLPFFNDMREDAEYLLLWSSDILDNTNRVMQIQISLESQRTNSASQKTNETVRFLTLFSVFFMPINFIAGVYGMNFNWMPALDKPYGFWIAVLSMILSLIFIYYWFRKKSWIG